MRIVFHYRAKVWFGLVLTALLLAAPGCLVRKQTRLHPSQVPPPAREATLAELLSKINSQSEAVRTLTATVDLEPTAGSVYSGIIKEYHDVKGFILVERPSMIRMLGQAPVVRTNIFDMVSNGEEFRLYIPPKQKFIVGKTTFQHPAKNALENLAAAAHLAGADRSAYRRGAPKRLFGKRPTEGTQALLRGEHRRAASRWRTDAAPQGVVRPRGPGTGAHAIL